jgi:hypothetical protein
MPNLSPSDAWRREVFESPPRRDVDRTSKSTTRIPIHMPSLNRYAYAEGGNEGTALLLLKYLQRQGVVKRFKEQPFSLEEIGGPKDRVPDILVELSADLSMHVIQCKSKRYLGDEVQARFDLEREFLEPRHFKYHIWTDRDALANPISETVRLIDRGLRFSPNSKIFEAVALAAASCKSLGPLVDTFGLDDSLSAAAHGIFYINILEKINEQSPISYHFSGGHYSHLFADRTVPASWWDTLAH